MNPVPLDSQSDALPIEPNRKSGLNFPANTFVVLMYQ